MSHGYKKRTLDQAVIFHMMCSSDDEVSTLAVSELLTDSDVRASKCWSLRVSMSLSSNTSPTSISSRFEFVSKMSC